MKRVIPPLILAWTLFVPTLGNAQVAGHLSLSIGFGVAAYSPYDLATGFGTLPHHCHDPFWYDPFGACEGYVAVGHLGYDSWDWHNPWRLGFLGWPSPRYVRFHWWRSPFGGFPRSPYWAYYDSPFGRPWYWGHGYAGYWGSPYWFDRYAWGRGSWGRDYDRHYDRHARAVRRSPLYGPRYKEYPTPPVYVTDNGPERPVSRAIPRGAAGVTNLGDGQVGPDGYRGRRGARISDEARSARPRSGTATGATTARPRSGTDARTARPRSGTVMGTPTARPRPRAIPRDRIAPPKREAPKVRPAPVSRRPSPTARPTPTRRPTPTARPTPSRRPQPTTRPTGSRMPRPKAKPTPSRAPKPKARPAPSRAPKPKARPAPRGSSTRKAPPRRPVRRPGI